MNETASNVLPLLDIKYIQVIDKKFGKVYVLPEKQIMICEMLNEYTPIEEFREIFNETVPFISIYHIKKFIFDKQNMRVFHQPSMEWYFVNWKIRLFHLGMLCHRKILPKNNPVFEAAVLAGRDKIRQEYDTTIIDKLDIQYSQSIAEAINS